MKVQVFIERENQRKTLEIKPDANISDLLKTLDINPVAVVVSKNNEIVTEETALEDKDKIEIFSVVSGG